MFISRLVEKANKSTNTKEATKIRRGLINFGIFGIVLGVFGVVICFLLFGIFAFSITDNVDQKANISLFLIPGILVFPSITIGVLGFLSLISGLSLIIVQKTTEFIDENIYCPNCNNMTGHDRFCNQCGASVLNDRICDKCKTLNSVDAKFCKSCGSSI